MKKYEYLDRRGTFRLESPDRFSYLYFPIANEAGVLGSVTPTWGEVRAERFFVRAGQRGKSAQQPFQPEFLVV